MALAAHQMTILDRIARKVADHLADDLAGIHTHLDQLQQQFEAATSTLTDPGGEEPGVLTTPDREALHHIRQQLGARYNPTPEEPR